MKKVILCRQEHFFMPVWDLGGGVLPYIDYIDMCSAKGYGFLVVLV